MKKTLLFILFVLFACNEDVVEKPQHLLEERQMADILYDISLLQAMQAYTPATLDANNIVTQNYIYRKYDIDSVVFAQNHRYYASKPEQYENIQESVLNRLEANKAKYDSLVKKDGKPPVKEKIARKRTPKDGKKPQTKLLNIRQGE